MITSEESPLFRCISYAPLPTGGVTKAWFNECGCDSFIHLDCVRQYKGDTGLGDGKWRGSVPIDEAQHQLIGFCNTCFDKMEQNRPETDMGGEDEDDDLEPE